MQEINKKSFSQERALFDGNGLCVVDCEFDGPGESPLKQSRNVEVKNSSFRYKYPLWYSSSVRVEDTRFYELGKSGIWYTNDIEFKNVIVDAPKEFRRCKNVRLENVEFKNAQETLWTCDGVELKKVRATGDYFAMNSSNMKCDGLELEGNYFFDGGKNIEVRNSRLVSKDAFWNCENVTVYDSVIIGEYLGWNSRNLTFVNCQIESNQGLCYIDGLKLVNCTFTKTDLSFEYCTGIDAEVKGRIDSVKNPGSGKIKCDEIGQLILDSAKIDIKATEIICPKIGERLVGTTDPWID